MSRTKSEHFSNFSLSVVIPTLNAAATLPGCLASLRPGAPLIREIIVVDGGSMDGTLQLTEAAIVLNTPAGRGGQLRAGIAAASGDFLLLLHADTCLSPNWPKAVAAASPDLAGYFHLRLDSPRRMARMIERIVALRCRALSLPYGDQGLLISRALLVQFGGMPDLPLMEDVALARRLKGRLRPLPATATTSAAKYEHDGWLQRPLRNLLCLTMYFAGVPPETIRKFYG
jgi:rSAM/selenodomain-associated transferase 2